MSIKIHGRRTANVDAVIAAVPSAASAVCCLLPTIIHQDYKDYCVTQISRPPLLLAAHPNPRQMERDGGSYGEGRNG
jgi:hypothetical protein